MPTAQISSKILDTLSQTPLEPIETVPRQILPKRDHAKSRRVRRHTVVVGTKVGVTSARAWVDMFFYTGLPFV
jgi:hypothetical protein